MDPDQRMDELLKASASARREEFGRDPSMPNPMRMRLHEEIASANEKKPRFSFAWPRLVLWTTAAATALALALATLWQGRETKRPTIVSSQGEANKPESATSERANDELKAKEAAVAAEQRQSAAKEAPAAAAPATALTMPKTRNIAQQFAQIQSAPPPGKSKMPDVLNSFKFEQDGETVRVIDGDGSTYTGKMKRMARSDDQALSDQKPEQLAPAKAAPENARLGAFRKETPEESANEFHIQASGYNNQLKKSLSFEGSYILPPTTSNEMQDKNATKQARIVGTAKIEGAPPVQINALAVPP